MKMQKQTLEQILKENLIDELMRGRNPSLFYADFQEVRMAEFQLENERRISSLEKDMENVCKAVNRVDNEIHELKKVYSIIMDITKNTSAMTKEIKHMGSDIKDMKEDIKAIKRQPIDEYRHYKTLIIGAIMLAVVSFLMGNIL